MGLKAVGIFNRHPSVLPAEIDFRKLGFVGPVKATDIWEMKDMGTISGPMAVKIPGHGVLFLRVRGSRILEFEHELDTDERAGDYGCDSPGFFEVCWGGIDGFCRSGCCWVWLLRRRLRRRMLSSGGMFDVRKFGAVADGKTIDSPAINKAIEAAAASGGGTVYFPAGVYASYSIRLKSNIVLYLEQGATILAANTSLTGTTSGYDPAEPNDPWESYQDYGHNHWHNSLIWGEGINNFAIVGTGLIWGKGLSRGGSDKEKPKAETPGAGNKAIALKNCHNVLLRDFSILEGGHFGILATGVDNLTIDNLKIDTNRDGMDIDCCKNVRVSNCSVNSPWDDGICPKSSFALGYARATENVTITNCYVTGDYQLGTMLDGTYKRWEPDFKVVPTGRIKCGTESNGGFKNITISNCVFESCRGFALESVDGALLEDITFTGVTMRDIRNSPIFLRLGNADARTKGSSGGNTEEDHHQRCD